MEARKNSERQFHNKIRTVTDDPHVSDTRWTPEMEPTIATNPLWVNMKYYSIERQSRGVVLDWFKANCPGKSVLDYCCGNGEDGFIIAQNGARHVTGIDLSETSVSNCNSKAKSLGLTNVDYRVMDAEAMGFKDNEFDVVTEYGALHHLDLPKAYSEIARVLTSTGKFLCVEALGHNPIIQFYRRKTPHLRTKWEAKHILRKEKIDLAKNFFGSVRILGFFHLATLGAVPFRNTRYFDSLLGVLEKVDGFLLRFPWLQWQAWQIVFELSAPLKRTLS